MVDWKKTDRPRKSHIDLLVLSRPPLFRSLPCLVCVIYTFPLSCLDQPCPALLTNIPRTNLMRCLRDHRCNMICHDTPGPRGHDKRKRRRTPRWWRRKPKHRHQRRLQHGRSHVVAGEATDMYVLSALIVFLGSFQCYDVCAWQVGS